MPFMEYWSKFDHTHENEFFRNLSRKLKQKFDNENGLHVLVGNISVNGRAIDAIFIRNGQISVIDFKDYSGKLYFRENGPWRIETHNGNLIDVKGGGRYENPFKQIMDYRLSLFRYLEKKQDNILENNIKDIIWGHTGGIVLFQGKIEQDRDDIPDGIKRWFRISDSEGITDLLSDINSPRLYLTDNEIDNLLKQLGIGLETPPILPPKPDPPQPRPKSSRSLSLEIVYYPDNEESFKQKLLALDADTRRAYVLLHKTDGTKESHIWNAGRFQPSSSVNHNLRSGYLRNWGEKGISKAEISTDINDLPDFDRNP